METLARLNMTFNITTICSSDRRTGLLRRYLNDSFKKLIGFPEHAQRTTESMFRGFSKSYSETFYSNLEHFQISREDIWIFELQSKFFGKRSMKVHLKWIFPGTFLDYSGKFQDQLKRLLSQTLVKTIF